MAQPNQPAAADRPLVSVVTVCRNASAVIRATMQSVLDQTFARFEYVLIDGASVDGTQAHIAEYAERFRARGVAVTVVSETDAGIYDAMNKSLTRVSGEWICFMNAGDAFCAPDTLARVFAEPAVAQADIVYGDTVINLHFGRVRMQPKPLAYFEKKMAFCHQSVFVRTRFMRARPFDLRYRLAADYDFFYYAYRQGLRFVYLPLPVALFEADRGASADNRLRVNREYAEIQGIDQTWQWRLRYALKWLGSRSKACFYACLPQAVLDRLRERNYERLRRRRLQS